MVAPEPLPPEESGAKQSHQQDLGHGWIAEAKAMLWLAVPLAFAQLATIAIQTTDVVMMGWIGPEALAAGQLGANLYMPLWLLALGIVTAVAPLAAQAMGAGDEAGVRRSVRQGLWIVGLCSVPAILILSQTEAILLFFGQVPANAALADAYMDAMMWSYPANLGIVVLRCFITVLSRTLPLTIIMLLGVGLNFVGNYMLMFGNWGAPELGLVGAGITSVIVYAAIFLALAAIILTDREFATFSIFKNFWRPDGQRFRDIWRLGLPIGVSIVSETGMFAAAGLMMGTIGTLELAGHGVAMQCVVVAFMLPLGVSHAATVRIGLAWGAGQTAGMARAGWSAFGLGLIFMTGTASLFLLFPDFLASLFLDPDAADSAKVVEIATRYLAVAAFFQLFDGIQVVVQGSLRGLQDTRVPMLFAIATYWGLGVPLCWFLGLHSALAGVGIWVGLALALLVTALLMTLRFRHTLRVREQQVAA